MQNLLRSDASARGQLILRSVFAKTWLPGNLQVLKKTPMSRFLEIEADAKADPARFCSMIPSHSAVALDKFWENLRKEHLHPVEADSLAGVLLASVWNSSACNTELQ